jgi:hypothetical protein
LFIRPPHPTGLFTLSPIRKRTIFAIWAGWAIIMLLYQVLVPARLELDRRQNLP